MKKNYTNICAVYCQEARNKGLKVQGKVDLYIHWFVKNKRKDKDNIRFGVKFIQDGMMQAGLLENDGWQEIGDYHDEFSVDKEHPRVEVELRKHGQEERKQ